MSTLPEGAQHEIDFWKRFIKSEQFATWLAPGVTPELDADVVAFMQPIVAEGANVLDVASGVVSIFHGFVPNTQLIPTDVLADEYMHLFDYGKHGARPPYPAAAEFLCMNFKNQQFEITHIRNGLDHCQNVEAAFMNMIALTKKEGYIIVQGFENEAIAENWEGFHQHNLFLEADALICESKTEKITLNNPEFVEPIHAQIKMLSNGKTWFIWIGKKIVA